MVRDALADAARWIAEGGLLAYPTETVWGLGADARSEGALARLRRWKGRDADTPISILVGGLEELAALGIDLPPAARRLATRFWPGPLTLVLPARGGFARGIARADGAIGVRCSPHPLASALARRLAADGVGPLTATSLNRSGEPPAHCRAEAEALCADGDDAPRLLGDAGADAGGKQASTVVDLTGARPSVLRWGALPEPALTPLLQGSAPA